tara:strand:- start:753 stop:1646 length:894 start_codon:yes stop_codon:yes gene_type:complete
MAFPSDISLPNDARYYSFVETKRKYNSNYDIVWSLQYKLPENTSTNNEVLNIEQPENYQLGFTTFLTTLSSPISALPGQYIGDSDPAWILSGGKLTTEDLFPLLTEDGEFIEVESRELSGTLLKIAFDTTGLYGVEGRDGRPGVGVDYRKRESLILRDYNHNVVYNEHLSAISTSFSTLSTDTFRTLRFRYVNLGQKLYIDYHDSDTTTYSSLTTIDLGFRLENYSNLDNIYCGFSFTTPVSTTAVNLSAKEFFLSNFHTEGYVGYTVLTETITSAEIPVNPNTVTSTVSNITARTV